MAAFVWKTNPRMWRVVAPFKDSAGVLKAYICDPSAYVYWSTPHHLDEIAAGDIAYIWRTAVDDDAEGIVACGRVEEAPRQLTPTSSPDFAFPPRLTPPGWDEVVAPSSWKTGIRIERTFWDAPIGAGLTPSHRTVGSASEHEVRAIEAEIARRG